MAPINLPNGNAASEVNLPDGSSAREVIGPDGQTLAEFTIEPPSSTVTHYKFEDSADSSTAVDSIGGNNATISGATYTTTATVGDRALSHASGDSAVSDNAVDIYANGNASAMGFAAWLRPLESTGEAILSWTPDGSDKAVRLESVDTGSGIEFRVVIQDGSAGSFLQAGGDLTVDTWQHIYVGVTDTTATLAKDGTTVFDVSQSNSIDSIGPAKFVTNSSSNSTGQNIILDDVMFFDDTLTDQELQDVVARGG